MGGEVEVCVGGGGEVLVGGRGVSVGGGGGVVGGGITLNPVLAFSSNSPPPQ